MPNMTLNIPHQLGRAEARQRVQELVQRVQQDLGGTIGTVEQRWTGDTLAFSLLVANHACSGTLAVEDQWVRMEIVLPWFLGMLSGRIQAYAQHQGQLLLGQRK
jgi:hypothetical protein